MHHTDQLLPSPGGFVGFGRDRGHGQASLPVAHGPRWIGKRTRWARSASVVILAYAMLLIVAAGPVAVCAAESDVPQRPNIIFILFDDLGYGEPPCYRADSPYKMPNLDRLARQGMRFTDAHTAAAVCTPTRYGVLTGRYPWRIGQFGVLQTFSAPIIDADRLTVGSLLQRQGYHTAAFGKWHLGMRWNDLPRGKNATPPIGAAAGDGPITRGFDEFCGFTHARNIGMILEQDKVAANLTPVQVQPMLADKAVDYLARRAADKKPFFLYVPLCTPHTPIVPAPSFVGKSGQKEYGDWIFQGDAVVGQIIDSLDRHQLAGNTLLIVASDNGAEHREYPPLRASKRSIYEGGHRVPMLARWPGRVKAGSVCDEVVCLNDLMATAAEITGAKLPDNAAEDSVSMLPLLLGTAKGPVRQATVHQSAGGDLAIRQGEWKLIFFKNGSRELYNLRDDIGETRNVAAANTPVVVRLTQLMRQYIDTGRSTPGAQQKNGVNIKMPS